jgi:saccharopine dehydrogenase-like NADP-dependent oxidoreductase
MNEADDRVTPADDAPLIVVLGAAGAVGRALSGVLAADEDLSLRLIDIQDGGMSDLSRPGVEVVVADIFAPGEAERLLQGATLLVNCLSLVKFNEVLSMAIDAGIDYADLISEPSEEQAAAVAARGITAVPGLGLSPGFSNVLVAHAARSMSVIDVDILFAVHRAIASSRGALDTTLWEGGEYSPERNYYLDGELVPAGPFDGARTVDFGGSFGEVEVYYRPHPEPKSLPKNFPSIRFAAVRGTWQPETMADLRVLNKYGLLSKETMATTKEAIWNRLGGQTDPVHRGQSVSKIEVRGVTASGEGVLRTYSLHRPSEVHSYTLTGMVAGLGAQLMSRRGRVKTGILEPEVYFDPDEYINAVRAQGKLDVTWTDEPWDPTLPPYAA